MEDTFDLPGKILVVDDTRTDVEPLIESLNGRGVSVIYLTGPPERGKCPSNIRLVVLDLDLDGDGNVGDGDISQAVLVLQRVEERTKFYLVAVWSKHLKDDPDILERLKNRYHEQTGEQLNLNLVKPFSKTELKRELVTGKIYKKISEWVDKNHYAGVVIEWERIIERSRDGTVSGVMNSGGIDAIVRMAEKEVGRESVPRYILSTFDNILHGRVLLANKSRMNKYVNKVLETDKVNKEGISRWYASFHNLQCYSHDFSRGEKQWTGDVFITSLKDCMKKYAILITPACDMAHDKTKKKVLYCCGYQLTDDIINRIHDAHGSYPEPFNCLLKTLDNLRGKGGNKAKKRIIDLLAYGKSLPPKFYMLPYFKEDKKTGGYMHILADMSNAESRERIPKNWKRICRVNSPWIGDILHIYSSFSSRVGTPSIPEEVKKAVKKELLS